MSASPDLFTDADHAVGSGLVLELDDESTNPVSTTYIEQRLLEASGSTNAFSSGYIEARLAGPAEDSTSHDTPQDCPISSLASSHLDCRLLFQPTRLDGISIDGAESLTLFPLERDESHGSHQGVQCLAVYESRENVRCGLTLPLPCDIYFDPYQDSVIIYNRTSSVLMQISQGGELITVPAQSRQVIAPGAWDVGTFDQPRVFQVLVFPRRRVLEVMALSLRKITGSKRRVDDEGDAEKIVSPASAVAATASVSRQLGCIGDLVGGETAHFYSPDKRQDSSNFTLFRMRSIGESSSAVVFEARHSGHPNQVIVVKAFKKRPDRDAFVRARGWLSEYRVHLGLNSETIVRLLGGDARVHALYLEHIDARDLSRWCEIGFMFRGDKNDALRILRDMAHALQYLRENGILHNDIKPGNILYSGKKAVLIDFGLGTFDGAPASSGGTPWYVGPEYMQVGEREAPCDMWALGVVMLYVCGQIRLPDSQTDAQTWMIRDVGPRTCASQSTKRMQSWTTFVRTQALQITCADSDLRMIVPRILVIDPKRRITPDVLVQLCEAFEPSEDETDPE